MSGDINLLYRNNGRLFTVLNKLKIAQDINHQVGIEIISEDGNTRNTAIDNDDIGRYN